MLRAIFPVDRNRKLKQSRKKTTKIEGARRQKVKEKNDSVSTFAAIVR
jgi:hypothetical protein